jgi:uncharacterized Zn finger protein (UPF0148 family)
MDITAPTFAAGVGALLAVALGIRAWRIHRRRLDEQPEAHSLPKSRTISEVPGLVESEYHRQSKCGDENLRTEQPPRSLKITLTAIGRLDNTCPNCGVVLALRPGRKTKCPHCGNFIFVRTRPFDRQRVLVTEEQARVLEAEWSSFARVQIRPTLNQEEMATIRTLLAKKFGKPPSDSDVAWAYLNQKTLDYAKHRQWGLYRNTRLSMAAVLEETGKLEAALRHYLEVCYLDLNGPQNRGQVVTSGNSTVAPGCDFSLEDAFLAPAVVDKIMEIILALKLDEHRVRDDFMHFAEPEMRGLRLPITPKIAWDKLAAELYR